LNAALKKASERDIEFAAKMQEAQELKDQQRKLLSVLANTTKSGWLQKCGHVRKNWSKRWFVLEKGVLRYYKSALDVAPFGKGLKGEIHLDHFSATLVNVNCASNEEMSSMTSLGEEECRFNIYNTLEYNNTQKVSRRKHLFKKEEHFILEMKADKVGDAQEWIKAINGHIEFFYKSKFDDLQSDDILSEGWLEKKNTLTKKWHNRWFVLLSNKLGKDIACCLHFKYISTSM